MVVKPPFQVPPEHLDLWNEGFEEDFKKWKAKESAKSGTKHDYRQEIININSEWNMEEVFDQIEVGLAAMDKIVAYRNKYPTYNMTIDLDEMYDSAELVIYKDFINYGVKLVEHYEEKKEQLRCDLEEQKQPEKEVLEKEEVKESVDLSQVERTPVKEELVEQKVETQEKKRRKKKKKNETRQKRLLKFHEKLVQTSGLPPSRLMKERQGLSKKNLLSEFELLHERSVPGLDAHPSVPAPSNLPALAPQLTTVPPPGSYTLPPSWGSPGSPPMICATTPTWTGCGFVGGTGWPEAGPMTPPNHLYYGSTSGSINPQSLSSCSPYSVGVSVFQPNPPVPPTGSPAYCFHCLQFGSVFTVSPV